LSFQDLKWKLKDERNVEGEFRKFLFLVSLIHPLSILHNAKPSDKSSAFVSNLFQGLAISFVMRLLEPGFSLSEYVTPEMFS
jgi:hypothetical protein